MLTLKGGAPFQLAKAVSRRAQQVTSRQLSAEDSPEITLYAFDGGEGVSEAHYAGETLYFGLTGAPMIRLGASEDVLDPGDAFVVPRDAKHSIGSDAPFQLLQVTLTAGDDHSQTRHLIKGHAVNLAETMDWTEGEVTSMTICQCPEISLTTFALAEGTRIGAHKSSGDALVMVLEGTAEITVGEETYQVKAGESLVMPAEIPHALKASEAFKMFLLVAF